MSSKLYVGNLSYTTTDAAIKALFGQHGEVVSVNLISDRETGRPKGFGFVEMGSPEEAEAAKNAVNGTELDGHRQGNGPAAPAQRRLRRRWWRWLWRRWRWRRLRRRSRQVLDPVRR